jgi:hypothetical protein
VSDTAGQASAFMAMTPIAPGEEPSLRAYLEALPQRDSPLSRLGRTHFARWVILMDFVNDPSQPHEDNLSTPYLVFTSNFDGPADTYLDELCVELAPEAQEIWGRCSGCPASAAGAALKEYLLEHRVESGFFVAAYPKATVTKVKASLDLRERMIELAVRSEHMEPAELRRAFDEEIGG